MDWRPQLKMRTETLKLTVIIIALYKFVCFVHGKNDLELVFDAASCQPLGNNSIANRFACSLSKNTKRRTFNLEMQFSQTLKQFILNLLVVLPRKSGDFVLLNLTNYKGCLFLANRNQVTLLQLTRNNLDRYSNMPEKCPFVKDKLYFIRSFRLDMDMLPAFTFETAMNAWFELSAMGQKLGMGEVKMRFVMKNKRKL